MHPRIKGRFSGFPLFVPFPYSPFFFFRFSVLPLSLFPPAIRFFCLGKHRDPATGFRTTWKKKSSRCTRWFDRRRGRPPVIFRWKFLLFPNDRKITRGFVPTGTTRGVVYEVTRRARFKWKDENKMSKVEWFFSDIFQILHNATNNSTL